MSDADVPTLIENSGAIKHGTFQLSNGSVSDYYIDKYIFETQPDVLNPIAEEIAEMLDTEAIDVIAGPELGAVPLATAVSMKSGVPAAFIRKGEKEYGTESRIEGTIEEGDRVALLEDVTTTGNTILETAEFVESIGATVARLIVVVDRNQGAIENLADAGFDLEYLTQVDTNLDVGRDEE